MPTRLLSAASLERFVPGIAFLVYVLALMWLLVRFLRREDALGRVLNLVLTGHPAEAEQVFRKALAAGGRMKPDERRRLLTSLGDALMDMGRYEESRQCLESALAMGDPTGSCRSSLADLWLMLGREPDKALEMANQAVEASTDGLGEIDSLGIGYRWMSDILRAGLWAQRAQALAGLGRMSESQESIGFAVRLASGARELLSGRWRPRRLLFIVATIGVSQTYWRIGMACLAIVKLDDARDSFSIGRDR